MGNRLLHDWDSSTYHDVSNMQSSCENCQRRWCKAAFSSSYVRCLKCEIKSWVKEDLCRQFEKIVLRQQTSCLSTFIKSTNNRCEASYRVAYHLVVAWKPYSDGQLVKRCLIDVVKCIHPGTETDYSSVALSQTKINKEASSFSLAAD